MSFVNRYRALALPIVAAGLFGAVGINALGRLAVPEPAQTASRPLEAASDSQPAPGLPTRTLTPTVPATGTAIIDPGLVTATPWPLPPSPWPFPASPTPWPTVPTNTPTPWPTDPPTRKPTLTPTPTWTPLPTSTPLPTNTPTSTWTPLPTSPADPTQPPTTFPTTMPTDEPTSTLPPPIDSPTPRPPTQTPVVAPATLQPTRTPSPQVAPATSTSSVPIAPSATAPATCQDGFEVDDTPLQARLLALSAPPQLHSFHTSVDVDYARIVVQVDRRYTIRTRDLAGGVNTRLSLYDTNGQTLITSNDDDPANPPASRIDWQAPANGTYFVAAAQAGGVPQAGCGAKYGLEFMLAVPPPTTNTATPTLGPTRVASATASPTYAPPPASPTPVGLNCLTTCVLAVTGTLEVPFPDQAVVHAQLLTPWGWPAAPPINLPLQPNGCVTFGSCEAGQWRVWVTVAPHWQLAPGTPPTQTVWIVNGQPCSQVVFRYVYCGYCTPGGGIPAPSPTPCSPNQPCPPGGGVPPPPGPPTQGPPGGIPTQCPPGVPCPPGGGVPPPPGPPTQGPPGGIPTQCPPGVPCPPGGTGGYPNSPDRPPVGYYVQLPILGYLGNDAVCNAWVEAQNIGDRPAKALLLVWGAPSYCPPQCAGPLKVECSGLLAPGSAWNFLGGQLPQSAKSGLVISANNDVWGPSGGDYFADALCETIFHSVVGNCGEYRRFLKAYTERGTWFGFDFGYAPCQPLAVEVLRNCPGDLRPDVRVTSSYAGLAGEFLGTYDKVYGGFAYFAPSLYAGHAGYTSILYIQNAGLECTSIELWFKAQTNCLRPRVCDVLTLSPGETIQFDASSCLPPDWYGNAWVRSSEPLAIAVDHVGNDVLMTYEGMPGELNYVQNGKPLYTAGSPVAFGPLIYSEYQGWDTTIYVQNLSATTSSKVKVYFLDRSGGVITTVADWVCAQGAQAFFLPVISNLPGNWVGSVRVESQDWLAPGSPGISAPNLVAVAQLVHYADLARTETQEAIAYNLFPEQLIYDWQLGSGAGGLNSGVGRIGIPSFHKDLRGTGVTSEISIANVVPKPGFTDFAIFIYDQNGLIDTLCEKLSHQQVEYIDLASWGFVHPGFKGSALISATFWEHDVFDPTGGFTRNVVGLAAVKVERSGTTLGSPVPGDEAAGNEGFPVPGPFAFAGPLAPSCPGQPPGTGVEPTPGPPPGGGGPIPPGPPTPFASNPHG